VCLLVASTKVVLPGVAAWIGTTVTCSCFGTVPCSSSIVNFMDKKEFSRTWACFKTMSNLVAMDRTCSVPPKEKV
jgi:hypothetical protein